MSAEIEGKTVILYNCIEGVEDAENNCRSIAAIIGKLIKNNKKFGALDLNDYKKLSDTLNFVIKSKDEKYEISTYNKKVVTPFLGCTFNQIKNEVTRNVMNIVEIYNDSVDVEYCLKYSFILGYEGGGFVVSKETYRHQIDKKFADTFK